MSRWDAPCHFDPEAWDAENNKAAVIDEAIEICRYECPFLAACEKATLAMIDQGDTPFGMIQAGWIFIRRGSNKEKKQEGPAQLAHIKHKSSIAPGVSMAKHHNLQVVRMGGILLAVWRDAGQVHRVTAQVGRPEAYYRVEPGPDQAYLVPGTKHKTFYEPADLVPFVRYVIDHGIQG